ncbi:pyridoxamine 5'-phosphate oxidase family protein [Ottowia sp. GY511]|uniref:Pyridoxamine 5'-phosphate oxidase family protein n=1 Tax=Ottowia flava TaxID=2675430 RepID=A0ABW4L069_9BURK|nr:pyridoxamine 5'-phosphate oxidase family protein [Ottowia sp. GY511]TXK23425.1 pyridoxamine 5'-phosphate oxidase family protein [Ottowia sp. GY511]
MADADNQPRNDLSGSNAGKKIREIAKDTRTCMFHTDVTNFPGDSRPMSLQEADEDGTCWFISSTDSEKNRDIAKDDRVVLTFQNEGKMSYLSLSGTATIHKDKGTIDKYWTDFANAWFDGKDDPRVSILKVVPRAGHYWETKNGKIVAFAKMSFAALTGSDVDDGGIDGALKPQ